MVMQIPNGISIEVGGVDADYVLYQVTVADGMFAGTAERAHDPPHSAIEVYGAAPSMTSRAALASVGLPGLESIAGELRAISRPDA